MNNIGRDSLKYVFDRIQERKQYFPESCGRDTVVICEKTRLENFNFPTYMDSDEFEHVHIVTMDHNLIAEFPISSMFEFVAKLPEVDRVFFVLEEYNQSIEQKHYTMVVAMLSALVDKRLVVILPENLHAIPYSLRFLIYLCCVQHEKRFNIIHQESLELS